jgi:TPR repeat protein
VSGIYNYALGLEHGHAGKPDPREVARFYKLAAERGSEQAAEAYARLAEPQLPKIHGEQPRRQIKA